MLTSAVATYDALRHLCQEISEDGLISSAREREQRKARIYWEIGDAIHSHLLSYEGKPRYGDQLYVRLARDLKMTRSHLYTIVQFRQQIPNVHTCGHLAGAGDPQETLEGGLYLNRQLLDEGLAGMYGAAQ